MENKSLNEIAEMQLNQVLNELKQISNELEIDLSDIEVDKSGLLGGPIENISKAIDIGKYAIGKYSEIVNKGGIMGDGKKVIIEEISKVKDIFKPKEGSNKVNPTVPGVPKYYDYSGGERARNVQAAGARPIDVQFNTDIKVRTYGDIDLNSDKAKSKFPVILSRQILDFSQFYKQELDPNGNLIPNSDSIMASYVNSVLNKLNNIAQANVNYSTNFTYSEIANWLSTLCNALNSYYGIYSIVQFEQDFNNKNEGMQFARRTITAQDFNYIDVFTMDLMSVPMPTRLPELFYMLNANYRFEELPKSPIIKFTSADVNDSGVLNFGIESQIKDLNNIKFRETCRKIFRALPSWRRQELPMYGPETYHSRNFNTIFMNSGHVAKSTTSGNILYLPTIDSSVTGYTSIDQYYVSNTNDLDGLTTALYAAYDRNGATPSPSENDDPWLTGLFKPKSFTSLSDNRCVFVDGKFERLDSSISHGLPFIHVCNNGGFQPGFGVNREEIYGLSPIALRETSKELVDWLFDLGSIPLRKTDGVGKASDMRTKSKSRSKRSRSKGRKSKSIGKELVKETEE